MEADVTEETAAAGLQDFSNSALADTTFPPDVEEVLAELHLKTEPLDQTDFNVVAYINELFPNEQSLSSIDEVMFGIQQRIHELDEETRHVIRGQWFSEQKGQEVVQDATQMIQTLFAKIREVQERATRSEAMVREITRDIQQLDQAKKNLTISITTLNNLILLINAVDRLRTLLGLEVNENSALVAPQASGHGSTTSSGDGSRQAASQHHPTPQSRLSYDLVEESLTQSQHVLGQMLSLYADIPVIKQLEADITVIETELARRVASEFKEMLSGTGARQLQSNAGSIQAACRVIDLLDTKIKTELLAWFIDLHLSEYRVLFEETQNTAWLDKIDHRYSWLKNNMLQFDKKFALLFPQDWLAVERLVVEFCRITRDSLDQIMKKRKSEMDHNILIFAVQRTHAFEENLAKTFTGATLKSQETSPVAVTGAGHRGKMPIELDPNNPFFHEAEAELTASAGEGGGSRAGAGALPANAPLQGSTSTFQGLISGCFEAHMHLYIENVEKILSDQLNNRLIGDFTVHKSSIRNKDIDGVLGDPPGTSFPGGGPGGPAPASIDPAENTLLSATDLFLMYKKVLKQALQLSRAETLLTLAKLLKKYLREYAQKALLGQLPSVKRQGGSGLVSGGSVTANQILQTLLRDDQQVIRFSSEDLQRVCVILVTASYCLKTAEDLERKLKSEVSPPRLSSEISFQAEMDLFAQCRSTCVQLLASDLESACDPALTAMTKTPWASVETVGDQSNYVTAIVTHLKTNVPVIRDMLHNVRAHFTQFCIRFADAFIVKFINSLYRCRPISTIGAEQLLLDTHSLKTALVRMPVINSKVSPQPPRSFTNVVQEGMGRAEKIIKVVMTPVTTKAEDFIDSFCHLLPDSEQSELQKIMEMKGLRRQDQNALNELYRTRCGDQQQRQAASSHGATVPSTAPLDPGASSRMKQLEKLIKIRR